MSHYSNDFVHSSK